ncbi:MAG TPA: tRNA (adenosine(37)-N6)-threonylcarbamoyltransferase complex transferase subunit TsaD [Candidatus Woesebacteria bacterium]|nr:tRNA (adenosine(37)-N6)-threonylcarbamoyltransferase complex transferase subunit TsaD [Candidatus Woesebacteria bacterium]HPJ16630.1 tRNA (adenosine(37)-N6)-threonylcarbamoyltransferase complex transferase subunit TsaD [Candidatus Woesebacteria bacterium]
MNQLAIETSCDDTCAAVLTDGRLISSVISSQTNLHQQWGGVVPDIAKRAHQQNIDPVVQTALKRAHLKLSDIDYLAVTQGPGLAIALSVGVNYAKDLALKLNKPLIAVNHIEGHLLSPFITNRSGNPVRQFQFPLLSLTVSGGHTKIILTQSLGDYQIIGQTLDDAAGESLDKAAKLLGLGYPGGPIIEVLSRLGNPNFLKLPQPLNNKSILNFSFSGLKTAFYYQIKKMSPEYILAHQADLAASFQQSVFSSLTTKFGLAISKYSPVLLSASGGVLANKALRAQLRSLAKKHHLPIYFPSKLAHNTDNAAMIGLVAHHKFLRHQFANPLLLDRDPRLQL